MSVASTGSEQLKMKSQECPPPAAAEAAQLHPSIGSTAAAAANYDLELIDCCRNGNLRKLLEIKDSKNYSSQYLISTSSLWETSLLHWSLLAPNIDVANYLITIGFDVNCKDKKYNMTPLQTAICHSSIRMVDLLMRNGAKLVGVSRENPSKNSELFLAKIHNKFATLAYLLENGADVGQADGNGECFIHHVVQATIDKSCLPLVSLYSPQVVEDCPRNSQRLTPQDLCLKNRRLSSLFQMRAAGFPMRFSQNFKRSMVSKWFEDYFIRQNKPLQLATTYFTIFYICCIISFFTFKVSLMQSHPKYYITSLLIHSLTILFLKALFRSKEMSVSEIFPLILTLNFLIYFLFDIRDSNATFLRTLYHIDIASLLFLIAFFLYSIPHHLANRNCSKFSSKEKKQFRDSVIRPKLQKLIKDPENHLTAEREFLNDICCYCLTTKKDAQHTFHCFICQRCVEASVGHSDFFNVCIDNRNVICAYLNLFCVALVAFGVLLHHLKAIPIAFYNNYLHSGLWITIKSIASTVNIKNITFSIASLLLLSQMPFWLFGMNYRP